MSLEEVPLTQTAAWYAIHTRHQHEKKVAHLLEYKGFNIYLPLYEANRRWRDRIKHLTLPLFPCYLFLHGEIERALEVVITPGVVDFVRHGSKPETVPNEQIEAVERVVQQRVPIEPHPYLQCGDRVRVKAGALEGLEGFMVRRKGSTRLVLSVELLASSASVEVNDFDLERITDVTARRKPA